MPDYELFELIAEKRTMSRSLEDYGTQKSTSISTARRLAEFLGDEMVKDKGLNCKYVISKKPEGAPVTERAIPIAIFQAEPSVTKHYLRKWLKAQSASDLELRNFLDWNYYIDRLNSCIQKIITIPAALQGVSNPVPRCVHPDWLLKRLAEKNSTHKQRKIEDMFSFKPRQTISAELTQVADIEDFGKSSNIPKPSFNATTSTQVTTSTQKSVKRKHGHEEKKPRCDFKQTLGDPPAYDTSSKKAFNEWLQYHKAKWQLQREFRAYNRMNASRMNGTLGAAGGGKSQPNSMTSFVMKSATTKAFTPWQILCISETTNMVGIYKMWVLADTELFSIDLKMQRTFYVNQIKPLEKESSLCRKANKHLPRSQVAYNLYEYQLPESAFQKHQSEIMAEFSTANVEGRTIYPNMIL